MVHTFTLERLAVAGQEVLEVLSWSIASILDELDGRDIISSSSCISSTITCALFAGGGALTPELAFKALVFVLAVFASKDFSHPNRYNHLETEQFW